jgi:hypothetical protein
MVTTRYRPRLANHVVRSSAYVKERVTDLRGVWADHMSDRTRIRDIMDGGQKAVAALFGPSSKYRDEHLPAANFLDSGMARLSQRLGLAPDVKVDPPMDNDGERKRYDADRIEEMINCYDTHQRLELQLPQQARWLPGYGFCVWVISQFQDPFSGHWYPVARIRDAFDCFPSPWNADEDPEELAIARVISRKVLEERYMVYRDWRAAERSSGAGMTAGAHQFSRWGNVADDATVIHEFYDRTGRYLMEEESGQIIDFWPNPLDRPPFVIARRFAFNKLIGQYEHVIGIQAMLAKMNILAFLSTEDSVFRETNIIGDPTHSVYQKGRFKFNYFPQGTQIVKPQSDPQVQIAFQQIDRLERHFRIGANYPTAQDAESPTSFSTGQGIDRLTASYDGLVVEYQTALAHALEAMDSLRLCWDETLYSGLEKPMYSAVGGETKVGDYDPARIKGWYNTRRVYGMMAGWDEPQKIVGGLQLLAGNIIDRQTLQENLHGLERVHLINERIRRDQANDGLMAALAARAGQNDPLALQALKKLLDKPSQFEKILDEVFPDIEAQPALPAGPGGGLPEQPPDVTTILSRLEEGGGLGGGAQTVAQI